MPRGAGATPRSEIEQEIVANASFALGSSRSSWFFEAALSMAARRRDVRAFEVALEAEAGLYAACPSCHDQFPSLGALEGLPFGFLGEDEDEVKRKDAVATEGAERELASETERDVTEQTVGMRDA